MRGNETDMQEKLAFSKLPAGKAELTLPNVEIISDWFSSDHMDRLEKIHGSAHGYNSYSVYEVYNSKGSL